MKHILMVILITISFNLNAAIPQDVKTSLVLQLKNFPHKTDSSGKAKWYRFHMQDTIVTLIDSDKDGIYQGWYVDGFSVKYYGQLTEGEITQMLFSDYNYDWTLGTVNITRR